MKKSTYSFALLFASAFLLNACNAQPEADNSVPDIIEVEIEIPETAVADQTIDIHVHVSQGEESVEDAKDVVIEIWEDQNRDNGVLEEAEHQSNGTYQIEHNFESDGIYLVQAHVTAREMHSMPIKPIIVGDVSEEEISAFNEAGGASSEEQGQSNHHHH